MTCKLLSLLFCMMFLFSNAFAEEPAAEPGVFTDVVILSTTDMHGKCWNTNILTGAAEKNNMLRVSTAVKQFREDYGAENVLLIDNGDLFQGTPVSQVQLLMRASGESTDQPAMALCLKEIGYDAFVLGNHEFNYAWDIMSDTYRWLEGNGVPVLAANACYDGSDPAHEAGENVFTPYVIKTITVNGHEHKIGILGFENVDITRWDLPVNYPGIRFVHPGNDDFSNAREAGLYIPQMKAEGCEFIIVSYHGGIGDTDISLFFGINSENQGMRMIKETEGIDFLVNGHDHSTGYSNTFITNAAGKEVPVVNGGGQDLTKTVFRFSEDENGALQWQMTSSENLQLSAFESDPFLEDIIRPYAEIAEADVEAPVGIAGGYWDKSSEFYTKQTDSMDLVSAAMMTDGTKAMQRKYGESGLESLKAAAGLDHLDVDMAMTSVTSTGFTIWPGNISMKDIYRLYRYANNLLVLPMYGRDILSIMEENAKNRLTVRVMNGNAYFHTLGDQFTNILFGGLNFVIDMSKPEGHRIGIKDFANGRTFDRDALYLVAVNNYLLGNERCGLRAFSADDALWSQLEDGGSMTIQDSVAAYIRRETEEKGTLTPDAFTWYWKIVYSADPAALPAYEGEKVASLAQKPEDGHTYVLYNESQGCALTARESNGGLDDTKIKAYGEFLVDTLPENALLLTAHVDTEGRLSLSDSEGRYLSCASGGGLKLVNGPAEDNLSLWQLEEAYGGWIIVNVGTRDKQALEFYSDRFTTYVQGTSGLYIFNFYEPD